MTPGKKAEATPLCCGAEAEYKMFDSFSYYFCAKCRTEVVFPSEAAASPAPMDINGIPDDFFAVGDAPPGPFAYNDTLGWHKP